MRIRTVTTSLIGLALSLALAAPAAAQGAAATSGPTFAAGVSFLNIAEDTGTGFQVDLSYPVRSMTNGNISVVGDFGWHTYGDDVSSLMFGGGVRFTATGNDKFQPFGQFLIGAFRLSFGGDVDFSETEMYVAPGGGVDVRINDKWNFRGQIDIPIVLFEGESETGVRFMFGVSTRIGS